MDSYVGFDSAWLDNQRALGAICAIEMQGTIETRFIPPELATFAQAEAFIRANRSSSGITLVAIDQPTIVPNLTSMRPVDRKAASLISWLGGGVQPANRSRTGMFCDNAAIWRFLNQVGATQDPLRCRDATTGLYLIEVFPAIAMPTFSDQFYGRLKAPKYNPGRKKTFRLEDWKAVTIAVAALALMLNCPQAEAWLKGLTDIGQPKKTDQDKLDAVICAFIAMIWKLRPNEESLLLGDLNSGYMVLPCTSEIRARLSGAP